MIDVEALREYCLSKPDTTEGFPFGDQTLVLRVKEKIFALVGLDSEILRVNLKCDPDYALELREKHPEVQPGYHMNKKHWNTVDFAGGLSDKLLFELVDHSYDLVAKKKGK